MSASDTALVDAEKNKEGPQNNPTNEADVLIGPDKIDFTDLFAGAECIADMNVIIAGRVVDLSFSDVCKWLAIIGNVAVACTLLLCVRIVARG